MSHSKDISRSNPGCIIFLVDHSNSMLDPIAGSSRSKAEAVATGLNRFFLEMITSCERGEDKPRNYFDVGGFSYTTDNQGNPIVESIFQGPLAGQDLVSVVQLYENPVAIEKRTKNENQDDGAGGIITVETEFDLPIWYQVPPKEKMFGTPMVSGLRRCFDVASKWCEEHPNNFPPIVIHLTDGESTEPEFVAEAERLKNLSTADGSLLLFNCHLSHQTTDPIFFPSTEGALPDDYGKDLYRMSSELPNSLRGRAEIRGISAPNGTRGMAFNADSARMLLLINIGTPIGRDEEKKNLLR